MSKKSDSNTLSAAELQTDEALMQAALVVDHLQQNPDFFLQHPRLLAELRLPHQQKGSISLVERQLELQRGKINALEEEITRLMGIARHNEVIFRALNQLHVELMQCQDAQDLQQHLTTFSKAMPGVHACQLFSFLDETTKPAYQDFELLLNRRLNHRQLYLGRLNQEEQQHIFPTNIHSVALQLIKVQDKPLALLAFGSEQDDHFQPEMDNLFLEHLAELVVRVLCPAHHAA
ncbi:DUF484 family protein [Alkalimonas collagenimarina]|uniref:DUF484 family protein n=1 Tax=Alkalimonas collagenimarina TaxID=400390 RepID=A0ABT9GXE4_9GAMM|nr:DUF484 family protein [Alkalimonas collagenimarina]MDP4535732.1 DUF484 family protein [Alkalimonas collagenimarina]